MAAGCVVWLADGRIVTDDALARYRAALDDLALDRCQRFVRPERQRQFILGRALLRHAVGAVPMVEQPPGPPRIEGLHVSLSHSGPWIACAVSRDTPIGLDIEQIDATRDLVALARQAFGAEDAQQVAAAPPGARAALFYDLWCRLEARYKLGRDTCHDYALAWPELAGALCAEHPLAEAPAWRIAVM